MKLHQKIAGTLVAASAFAVLPLSVPAHAEVDATYPTVVVNSSTRGKATVKVDWKIGAAVVFSGTTSDTSPDGYCITAFRALRVAGLGVQPFKKISGSTVCGNGESQAFTQFVGYEPLVVHGAYTQVCRTNSSGSVTGACGAPRYAANDGS